MFCFQITAYYCEIYPRNPSFLNSVFTVDSMIGSPKYDGSTIPIGSHETGIFTRVSMVFRGLTTYLYWGYNPVTKYHGHPSTYIWLNFMVDVGKYTIHGCYGYDDSSMYKLYTVRFYQQSQ